MVEMRWVEKVGLGITQINKVETVKTKVLQYRHQITTTQGCLMNLMTDWIDVTTVEEKNGWRT